MKTFDRILGQFLMMAGAFVCAVNLVSLVEISTTYHASWYKFSFSALLALFGLILNWGK